MPRRRIFWHIGPDDVGTRFLADALDASREQLAERDVLVPGSPAAWQLASAEVLRTHREAGFRRDQVEGQTDSLLRRVWKHKGTSVLSTPSLAAATPDQVALALDAVRDVELHVVLVVRDAGRREQASTQAALESGRLTADATPTQEMGPVVQRWGRTALAENVHVIEESEPAAIWAAIMGLLGVEVALPAEHATAELDAERAAVLRDVVATLGSRIDAAGRRTAVRDLLVDTVLARPEVATATAALAEALLEVARLQQENEELREENARLDRKRRKHKRRIKELSGKAVA